MREASMRRVQNVITILEATVEAIREAGKNRDTYEWNVREDPDHLLEKIDAKLAARHALDNSDPNHIAQDFILLPPALYSGKMRIIGKDNVINPDVEKSIRETLTLLAANRNNNLRGRSVSDITAMDAQALEVFRKEVCSQRNGAIQFENYVLYWLASDSDKWSHHTIGRHFPAMQALYKVPGKDRCYAFKFTGGAVTQAVREARTKLRDEASKAEAVKRERERVKMEKKAERERKKAEKAAAAAAAASRPVTAEGQTKGARRRSKKTAETVETTAEVASTAS